MTLTPLIPLILLLLLEGVSKLDPDEKHVIKQMVEGIMLKHQAKQLVNTG